MNSKIESIILCVVMVASISAPITIDVGEPDSCSSGGGGGLADSPWPMFRQNVRHTGLSPYDTSENLGTEKWNFMTGNIITSSATIGADGTIYVGSHDNKLYAINSDGTQKWNFTTGYFILSTAAIAFDGTIYVGSHDYKLYAINPDGTQKWNFTTDYYLYSSPAIDSDGTIYIGSWDNRLYAINPNGTEKWNFETGNYVYSSPAIGSDGTIYVGSMDYKLYAINPDGSEKWNFTTDNRISFSSPAIGSDGTIYIGSHDKKLYAINPDGSEKWNFMTGAYISSSPAIGSDGTIYIGSSDYKVYAINPDGTQKWNFTTGYNVMSSPAIGSDGTIYVGSYDDKLYAINPDGTEKWNFETGDRVLPSPTIGPDGTIYIGSRDNILYAIGNPNLEVSVSSHFSELNSAAQSAITVHVTDGTNPVQGATITLSSDNGGMFSPLSGTTNTNGNFKSIFNTPTATTQTICRITAQASKTGYNDASGYVDITVNPIPWPMFRHNLNHTGLSPYDTSANPGKLKWSFTTCGNVTSSPAIDSDGTIYVGSYDKKLYAINPDGTEKWSFMTDSYLRSSPAIGSDGTIYVGSDDDKLYAINPDCTHNWSFTTGDNVASSPTIGSDGTIYVGSEDKKLYALNPDGSKKWEFTTGRRITSSPAIGSDGTVYISSGDNKLYAINQDGTEKWSFTTNIYGQSSPAIGSDGTIYIGSWDKKLHAINQDGTKKWNFTTGGYVRSSPAIGSDGTIYVGSDDERLYAINPDGTQKWNFTTGYNVMSSPAIGSDGTIYVGSYDDKLYAINPDGTQKWNFTAGDWIYSSPAIGTDGTIYFGSWDGKLYAIGTPTQTQPPVADAGPDQTVNEGESVQFNGSGSSGIINVLHVSIGQHNELQMMIDYTGSTDNFSVTQVGLIGFNTGTPNDLSSYDAIVFGLNNGFEMNSDPIARTKELEEYVFNGGGIVWTHDSLEYIWDYGPDLEVPAGVDCDLNPYNVTGLNIPNAEIIMDHEILHNLFEIGNIGDLIPKTPYPPPWFHYTHTDQSYVTTADIIIQHDTLPGSINFYLTTEEYGQGRVALDVIGHTVAAEDGTFLGIPSLKECQILVNAIYWVAKGKKMPNIISYSWDFDANVDSDGDGNNTNDADATGPTPTHIYGDNGVYIVTLKITDETGATAADTCNITVLNVAPTVDLNGPYSGSEGSPITFTSMATDPGSDDLTLTWNWGDGTPAITSTYYNNGIGPEPIYDPPTNEIKSPEGTFPFDVTDTLSHTYGDNGVYTITLTVVDDDGKTTVITADVVVNNVAPAITLVITPSGNEGSTLTFEADATDAGSDDLVFSWEFEYGPTIDNTYYNNGVSPEPVYDPITNEIKSPQGTYPFNASDMVTHTYGDNYDYTLVLTVYDDDDGISVYTTTITIDNVAPSIIELAIPYVAYEGTSAAYRATAKDLGSDDLTFEWDFGDSTPVIEKTFYNNGTTPDPYPSPDGILPFIAQDTLDHTYGDNYNYTLTFKVTDDDGGVTTLTTTVYVNNVAPTIEPFGPFAVDEGMPLDLTAISTDLGSDDLTFTWEFEYGPTITNAHYNDGVNPDPYPSPGGNYPFNVTDTVTHTYGDNGVFTVTLTVTDDDDGLAIYTTNITVNNVAPTINPIWPMALIFEGTPFILSANSTDQGSDDLTFTWEFELGPTITNIYYNDGTNLDPYPSPWGTYPFSAVDQVSLTYGDNGVYAVTVTVEDDDKGIAYFTANIIVYNLAPTIEPFGPFTVDEGKHVDITATSTDPGSDDLTFTWQFDYGPTYVSSYYNDGTGPDPYPSPWGTYPFSVLDDVTHTYGDNGVFLVILMVEDDDGGSTTFITNITVKNMAPAIENIEAYMYANISLRVAGEKYHSVDIYLYEENSKIWTGKVTRYPGSPDEQKATITNVKLDMTKRYSAKVDYLPNDPRVNGNVWGGNPVWIEIEARYGSTAHIHHTFNVRQSYWDSDHWNHIDPWEVELNPKLVGLNITFEAEASDPGSDDLEFTWDFGDSNSSGSNIYYNNGLSPDPYPSPEINPMIAIDTCIHAYTSPNIYTITIVVTDDDGGFSTTTLLIILSG